MLNVSCIQAGRLPVEVREAQIGPLIEHTVEGVRLSTDKHTFSMHVPAGLPRVMADAAP